MTKSETIWHHILLAALNDKRYKWTQQELAKTFAYSLSTINHAVKGPTQIGAIRKESKFFVLSDFQKLLYYWASLRKFQSDIIYETYFSETIQKSEGLIHPKGTFACYSAAAVILEEPPADYSKVYFYIRPEYIEEVRSRYPKNTSMSPNVFVLKNPPRENNPKYFTSIILTFVDIWNLNDWYSKDFVVGLEEKINGILS